MLKNSIKCISVVFSFILISLQAQQEYRLISEVTGERITVSLPIGNTVTDLGHLIRETYNKFINSKLSNQSNGC